MASLFCAAWDWVEAFSKPMALQYIWAILINVCVAELKAHLIICLTVINFLNNENACLNQLAKFCQILQPNQNQRESKYCLLDLIWTKMILTIATSSSHLLFKIIFWTVGDSQTSILPLRQKGSNCCQNLMTNFGIFLISRCWGFCALVLLAPSACRHVDPGLQRRLAVLVPPWWVAANWQVASQRGGGLGCTFSIWLHNIHLSVKLHQQHSIVQTKVQPHTMHIYPVLPIFTTQTQNIKFSREASQNVSIWDSKHLSQPRDRKQLNPTIQHILATHFPEKFTSWTFPHLLLLILHPFCQHSIATKHHIEENTLKTWCTLFHLSTTSSCVVAPQLGAGL